ncbi:TetR/AcrR family transcriptional regulator [Nonomuraea dietziae]|uniref:AcrR family transcriptional regulator n=2 Tax=Nonomuraea dietziae TaxID=65515 RepID=A0A7W5VBJ3_9ACTN|nr:TetR/AcrR family transcriptional regulator [Nonomuraea dietziae]MBB3729103.1 AcrR family transcriptional regulator [Nonomuraea dietziae]
MVRMSAEERRESVIRAAISEFAHGGYHGTSTETIARRVGVSQPYLFRLFPGKQAIFLAAATRCLSETRRVLEEARTDADPHMSMAAAYKDLIKDRDMLLMQMQVYVAVAAMEDEFGAEIRKVWEDWWDSMHLLLGTDTHETTFFMSYGMLINTLVSLGFPSSHRVWADFAP